MSLSSVFLRRVPHGSVTKYKHAYDSVKNCVLRRKVLFGSTILFGAAAPTLLSNSYSQFALESHIGDPDARTSFQQKYGHILQWYRPNPVLYTMIGINVAVFCFWKISPQFMTKHFLCNLENLQSKRYYVLLTANWSHMDFWHVGLNMYVLYNFGSIMIKTIGIPAFGAVYVGAGLLGSIASVSWHVLSKMPHYSSLGASASLLGIIVAFAMYEPSARFKIVFSPDSLSFSAYNGVIGICLFDCLGLLMRWRFLDHAAHLMGSACGFVSWQILRKLYGTSGDEKPGLLCINGQYMFEGYFKDYKKNANVGKIYSPSKTYYGEMLLDEQFSFHGRGALRNELNGSVFYGNFRNGKIDGVGLLCWDTGKVFPAKWDAEHRQFEIPTLFDPEKIHELIDDDVSVTPILENNPKYQEKSKDKASTQPPADKKDVHSSDSDGPTAKSKDKAV